MKFSRKNVGLIKERWDFLNIKNMIDIEVLYAVFNKGWSLLKTPLTLFFITRYLTTNDQGYWYTFLSLGALTVFAELGFTTIVTQFVSHEFANLQIKNKLLVGENKDLERIFSLLKFSFKVYCFIVPAGVLLISLIGILFFASAKAPQEVIFSWVLYSFVGGFTLFVTYLGAVFQGLNKVKEVLKLTFYANIFNTIIIWVCLYLDLKTWSLSIAGLCFILVHLIFYLSFFKDIIKQTFQAASNVQFNWLKEILPLQIKFSVSWIAGYFIFNFFVPITMYYLGTEEAGKLGISLSVTSALLQIAHSWVSTKIPTLNMFVSRNDLVNLNSLFHSINNKSLLIYLLGAVSFIVIYWFIFPGFNLTGRFLEWKGLLLLLVADFGKLLLGNWAVYLRAFKKERFLFITIVNALLTAVGLWIGLGIYHSFLVSIISYSVIQVLILLPGWRIFSLYFKRTESTRI